MSANRHHDGHPTILERAEMLLHRHPDDRTGPDGVAGEGSGRPPVPARSPVPPDLHPAVPSRPAPGKGGWAARTSIRMAATIGWLPVWMSVATVVGLYVLGPGGLPLGVTIVPLDFALFGLAGGLLGWLIGCAATSHDVLPARANPRSFDELQVRMIEARASIVDHVQAGRLAPDAAPVVTLLGIQHRIAMVPPDAEWASGLGYVMAWRDLHHVEESLIDVADAADLERVFHHDRLRVNGSKLERNGSLVPDLIARAEEGFKQADRAAIRPVLRAIRTAVNDFRDRRFEGLVRSRMHVERVSLLLGLASWALLCLAILAGAGRVAVTGVAALYLIGAAAGLTTQLRSRAAESLEDVFGYGQAQLRQVVLMSGLAAVGGVFLTTMAGSTSAGGSPVDISGAFDFNGIAVLTAAAFGLAPGMLTDRIQGWAGRNLKDLESTTTEGAATQA